MDKTTPPSSPIPPDGAPPSGASQSETRTHGAIDPSSTGAPGAPVPDPTALPAELIDHPRYRVTALIGRGGMGAVYKAEHRLMERTVALKVIKPGFVGDPRAVQRFRHEVKAAASLHHPNIVAAYDADEAGGLHFLVMEYVEGQSLAEYLRPRRRLPWGEACDYARQAALGLQHAHDMGMVHRDVKPHNLMRTAEGQIKILDFGLARLGLAEAGATQTEGDSEGSQLTLAGAVMGTADYMAPEQALDAHGADGRADVYSLGCTLYQLLTGGVPFAGGTSLDKLMRHAVDRPAPPGSLRAGLPHGLAAVVLRMMAKDPAARYQTPGEAAQALAPFALSCTRPRRRWVVLVTIAAVLIAAGTALGAALMIWAAPRPPSPPPAAPASGSDQHPDKPGAVREPPPDLSNLKPEVDDDFHDPARSVFHTAQGEAHEIGFADGLYFQDVHYAAPGAFAYWRLPGAYANFACQIVGRLHGQSTDGWGASLAGVGGQDKVGLLVKMNADGRVELTRPLFAVRTPPSPGNPVVNLPMPTRGPVRPAAAKPADEFNTLLVVKRGSTLDVYVNGSAVYDPIQLDPNFTPLGVGIETEQFNKEEVRAEFKRFTVWRLPEIADKHGR